MASSEFMDSGLDSIDTVTESFGDITAIRALMRLQQKQYNSMPEEWKMFMEAER